MKHEKITTVLVAARLDNMYTAYIKKLFGPKTEIVVFNENEYHSTLDLIFLTGGADVDPSLYNERKGSQTHVNEKRDTLERLMVRSYNYVPKLGICRGAQFLTALAGGKLVQHVNGHSSSHSIQTSFKMAPGHFKKYEMSSSHHQMMYPYNLPTAKFKLLAWSEYHKSTTYLNGHNNEIELPTAFLEPEIVYYPELEALCIQGHPEYSSVPDETVEFTNQLIKEFLL